VIGSTTIIVLAGGSAISTTQDQLDTASAENAMTQLDSQASLVALGQSSSQSINMGQSNSQYAVDGNAGWMNVSYQNRSLSNDITFVNATMGSVRYDGDGGSIIAYQGGGVWRSDREGNTVMVSPPELHYRGSTLTLPLVTVEGDGTIDNTAIFSHNDSVKHYPNESLKNPLEDGKVTITIKSDYYRAWGRFLQQRTEGTVSYPSGRSNVVVFELTVPADYRPVEGGIVKTGSGTLTINNNAGLDSYNSSRGSYGTTTCNGGATASTCPNVSSSKIVAAGDLDIAKNGNVYGDVEIGGSVAFSHSGAELESGNISHGAGVSGTNWPAGWINDPNNWEEQNASVQTPDAVSGLVYDKVTTLDDSSNNDNGDTGVDIDSGDTLTGCSTDCTINADSDTNSFYLSSLTVPNNDKLVINTNGQTVDIAVDGPVDLNGDELTVNGNGRVNIYSEGDVTMDNGFKTQLPGDNSSQLWIYTRHDNTVTMNNNVQYRGVIYAPGQDGGSGADVEVKQNVNVFGGIVGNLAIQNQNVWIHYDESLTNTKAVRADATTASVTYLHVSRNSINVTSGG